MERSIYPFDKFRVVWNSVRCLCIHHKPRPECEDMHPTPGSEDIAVYKRQHRQWMREHPHLSIIAARLRSAAVEGPLDEPPEEIKALLEKLAERETGCTTRDEVVSESPPPLGRGGPATR
jgi:hypothetical protein